MYKAKIISVLGSGRYMISIPSIGVNDSKSYSIGPKNSLSEYEPGDLVIVSKVNSGEWVIIGYVYGQGGYKV